MVPTPSDQLLVFDDKFGEVSDGQSIRSISLDDSLGSSLSSLSSASLLLRSRKITGNNENKRSTGFGNLPDKFLQSPIYSQHPERGKKSPDRGREFISPVSIKNTSSELPVDLDSLSCRNNSRRNSVVTHRKISHTASVGSYHSAVHPTRDGLNSAAIPDLRDQLDEYSKNYTRRIKFKTISLEMDGDKIFDPENSSENRRRLNARSNRPALQDIDRHSLGK